MVWICRRLEPVAMMKKSYRGVMPLMSRTTPSRHFVSAATRAERQARSREVKVVTCPVVASFKRPPSGVVIREGEAEGRSPCEDVARRPSPPDRIRTSPTPDSRSSRAPDPPGLFNPPTSIITSDVPCVKRPYRPFAAGVASGAGILVASDRIGLLMQLASPEFSHRPLFSRQPKAAGVHSKSPYPSPYPY